MIKITKEIYHAKGVDKPMILKRAVSENYEYCYAYETEDMADESKAKFIDDVKFSFNQKFGYRPDDSLIFYEN